MYRYWGQKGAKWTGEGVGLFDLNIILYSWPGFYQLHL